MEKNPLQHTHQYPLHFKWSLQRIEKNATNREIPPYPLQFKWSLTMEREIEIYTPGRRSQIMFKWSLQRTDVSSSNPLQFKPRCRNFKPTLCFFFFFFFFWRTHFVLRFDGVMKCEREVRKGGKFWLKYFQEIEKEKWSSLNLQW